MSEPNTTPNSPETKPLKIGSRVRCPDDGVEGRITWANAVSVKIEWSDGEKVTWRRDSLATRPIEILEAEAEKAPTEEPLAITSPAYDLEEAKRETTVPDSKPTAQETPEVAPVAEMASTT